MKELLTIDIKYDEYHIIFPRIIMGILILLVVLMLIKALIKRLKDGSLTQFKFKFFEENFDKLKLFGTIGLIVVYVFFLEIIGFIASSIVFMFLLTILLKGNFQRKTIVISVINSVTTSILVWFFFGYLFDITLP
ncbi:Tripartite tricarboxylate transporter TctB family protein [Mesobacillus persicus]|uniref:Tripartite tricarboxylate transporter TctB family protein n=1 Tax=Mesobacillus persicus TaxID=930146 RepID=A0A1H7Z4Z9_9BACI|nr:tripartite tricarboxylate transporter TctB family protein [Mesobacillus persicus]SEM53530.1 Tripartite tricarboxylate transporter TctB family protein [Mesobacillus persicus]